MLPRICAFGWRRINRDEKQIRTALTFLNGIVSDVSEGVTDDLLVVDIGRGRDLSEDHDHACLGAGLARDTGYRILTDAGVKDGI